MAYHPTEHDLTLLQRAPLYAALPALSRQAVFQHSQQLVLKRGDALFRQGDPAESVFMVLEGWLKVYRLTPDGGETVLHVFRSGETLAEPAAFGLGRYPATAEAACEARILQVPAAFLIAEIDRAPQLVLKVIGLFSQRLHALVSETERRQFLSTPHRLAAFLLDLMAQEGVPSEQTTPLDLSLPYDKALVAARLGMTPESFSRALAKLKPVGIDSNGSHIHIRNPQLLRDFVPLFLDDEQP